VSTARSERVPRAPDWRRICGGPVRTATARAAGRGRGRGREVVVIAVSRALRVARSDRLEPRGVVEVGGVAAGGI